MGKWLAILCLLGCGARSGLDTSSDAGSDPPPPRRDGGRTPMRDGGGPRPRDAGMLPTDGTCVIERLGDDGAVQERSTEWRDTAGLIVRSMIEHPLSAGDEPAVWTYTYDDARRIVHVDMRQG